MSVLQALFNRRKKKIFPMKKKKKLMQKRKHMKQKRNVCMTEKLMLMRTQTKAGD